MAMRFAIRTFSCAAACFVLASPAALSAQRADPAAGFPSRPIRVVVPFTPGGQPDIVARLIAPKLSESFNQMVIVDNRPGAGGMIGARIVAGATPDGHTMMLISAAHAVTPAVRANLGYDPVKDFAGITMAYNATYLLVVPLSLEARNVKDLIALAKARPGQLNFSSAGVGSGTHFAAEMFKQSAGIDVVHTPHRGIPEALTDTMTGRVQFFMAPMASASTLVKEGKLRGLGVSSPERSRVLPDIPTIAESAIPGFRFDSWGAMFAPGRTPRATVNKLNREITRILKLPDVEQRLLSLGAEPAPTTPGHVDKFIAEQIAASLELARKAGIKPE
ncbi:MAG: tripartite tricarboxylate transporter substrate binding protein [Betaproteobacteria bacterium]|nr:tripartite tricarboxylate transporter substrate binding protein [Betaproteobacteria bacterium]